MDTFLITLTQSHIERESKEQGIHLTAEQALAIAQTEHECLAENRRVSFGDNTSLSLIREFADSPFLVEEENADTLIELTETFYTLREDFPASIGDTEIIQSLKNAFNGEASGEVQLAATMTSELLAAQLNHREYEIVDDDGKIYRWDPEKWHDNITADGWFGEKWADDSE